MSETASGRPGAPPSTVTLDDAYDLLADPIRRAIVRAIRYSPRPVTVDSLVSPGIDRNSDQPSSETEDASDWRMRLRHVHLPKLTAAGVVRLGRDGLHGDVMHGGTLDQILDGIDGTQSSDDQAIDRLFSALTDSRRRLVLSILATDAGPRTPEHLAEAVAHDAQGAGGPTSVAGSIDRIRNLLIHVDLPTLADAGLITYDGYDEPVKYQGHPLITKLPLRSP